MRSQEGEGRIADVYFPVSHRQPKLIVIDKQSDDDVTHLVAYLLVADNVSGPLLTRLIDPSQPVIHTGNEFSRPRLALLASI
jgi:hypothetical protein